MTTPPPADGPDTPCWALAELIETAGTLLSERIGEVEGVGTVSGFRPGRHLSFARLVVHADDNQVTARIPVVFRPNTTPRGVDLNGSQVRVTGRLTGHLLYGPIQLTATGVRVVDAESSTTRAIKQLRTMIIDEGLRETNKRQRLRYDARRIALVCPIGRGAGGADVLHRLAAGAHEWDVTTVEVPMGGPGAAAAIAAAITEQSRTDIDVVLVCRGGGAASDLAPFDSADVARAIVESPVPVIVAVGHATDAHVADLVAHTTLPTPSAAADWLNQQRNAAVVQAQAALTKAARASALAKQAAAEVSLTRAADLEAAAVRRERRARQVIATAIIVAFIAVLVVILL